MKHEVPRLLALDLDGVLTDTRRLHILALESTLEKHGFPVHESLLWELDGLSTKQRLGALVQKGLLPGDEWFLDFLDEQKARITDRIIQNNGVEPVMPVEEVERLLLELKSIHGCKVCVVSNARRSTVELCLGSLGKVAQYIDFLVAGDDGRGRKPDPEPYITACEIAGVRAHECVAVDDSPRGRMSARLAGTRLLPFDASVSAYHIRRFCETGRYPTTIVVPMAGRGSRFAEAGHSLPKPLIDVVGKPMIERALDCLPREANFVFVLPPEFPGREDELPGLLARIRPNSVSWRVSGVTEGAACTVLATERYVEPDERLVVANCDQLVHEVDWDEVLSHDCLNEDGFVLVFEGSGDKWSYAIEKLDTPGYADAFIEKRQVGNMATCGVYGVNRAWKLYEAIREMMRADDRTNGEFYLCPALNYLPPRARRPLLRLVQCRMTGLGTPEDLAAYVRDAHEC